MTSVAVVLLALGGDRAFERAAIADCLRRAESPSIARSLFCLSSFLEVAKPVRLVVYRDCARPSDLTTAASEAASLGLPCEFRSLPPEHWSSVAP